MTTTTTKKEITIQTGKGPRIVPAKWIGQTLAVHRPLIKGELARKGWAITAHTLGLAAAGSRGIDAKLSAVLALAKAWDARFADLSCAADGRAWRWQRTWAADVADVMAGRPHTGPLLPDVPTSRDVAAAMGCDLSPPDEAAEQFQAAATMPRHQIRGPEYEQEIQWRGRWWPVPTIGEIEAWMLDSICETPDGRTVEPDHPESWLSVLGLI